MLGWYPIFDGFTVVPVQLFFAERAVRINGNSLVIAIVSGVLMYVTMKVDDLSLTTARQPLPPPSASLCPPAVKL